jgi:hypothetical protein
LIYLFPAIIAGNPVLPSKGHTGQALETGFADRSCEAFAPFKKKTSNRELSNHPLPLNVRSFSACHIFISMIPSENVPLFLLKKDKKAINIAITQRFSSGCLRHIWQPPRFIYTT